HRDRDRVPRRDKKRGVQNVLRLLHLRLTDLKQNVPRLYPRIRGRGVEDFCNFSTRSLYRITRLGNVRPHPSVTWFTEPDKVAANLFRGLNWQCVAAGIVLQAVG